MNAYKMNTYLTTIQIKQKNIARTLLANSLPLGKHNFPSLLTILVIFAFLYSFTTSSVCSLDIIVSAVFELHVNRIIQHGLFCV